MRTFRAGISLRILLVSAGLFPPDFAGGQLRVLKTFVRLRERYSFSVSVLALSGKLTHPGWSEVEGIRVRRLVDTGGVLSSFMATGLHLISEKRAKVDVVYTLTTGRLVYITVFWARLLRLPVVAEFINANLEDTAARKAMVRFLAHSARLNIAISQPVARQLRALGVPDERIWVRPNPVDIETFKLPAAKVRADARRKLSIKDDQLLHILVGSVETRKNQILGVEALEKLPSNHDLIIVGPVLPQNEAYAEDLRQKIAASPARERIHLVDRFVDDIETYMYAADCLWMPSKEEGLGNVMLEALCCGVPCIINRELGMDEHIMEMINGFQAQPNAHAWAEAITAMLAIIKDVTARGRISQAAQSRYKARTFDDQFFAHMSEVANADKA
ncbi:MAG: glycosyltransferase family 4 protein [Hyphomicrobiales bacterium]|nr:glycosyltransferase family 4 protein [Hyphomicrobiales bacterium]